ncbi:MAG: acetylxylan esterase [Thermoguttaceae bacterium]|nr:acetylxylan esterase [Thermoguttaceae bacterium]
MTKPPQRRGLAGMFAAFLWCAAAWAGDISFYGTTDKDPLSYAPGETMTFTVSVLEDGQKVSGKDLLWTRRGDDGKVETGRAVSDAQRPLVIQTSLDVPGFVWIQVAVVPPHGELPLCGDQHFFNGGAGVRLDEIKGAEEPADFDEYWARQKARLAAVPMTVSKMEEVPSGDDSVLCYDLRVECLGMPVSGYLCLPKDAPQKSLPAHLFLQGYGLHSAVKRVAEGKNQIALEINAHGYDNSREEAYYVTLGNTALRAYGFFPESNAEPQRSYWNGVALRIIRALEYLKSLPQWNGKTIVVSGGSQGGFQSLLAAGLDSDVTHVQVYIPWMCDISGSALSGRVGSIFMPSWTDAMGYFDAANHAKRIKAAVVIDSGLGDYVCPPSGQLVLFNNISSPVKMTFYQGRTHLYVMPGGAAYTLEK